MIPYTKSPIGDVSVNTWQILAALTAGSMVTSLTLIAARLGSIVALLENIADRYR